MRELDGKVTLAGGRPHERCRVHIGPRIAYQEGQWHAVAVPELVWLADCITDTYGKFSICRPAEAGLLALAEDEVSQRVAVVLLDPDASSVAIETERAGRIEGVLSRTAPIEGAIVRMEAVANRNIELRLRSDHSGVFRCPRVPPGEYRVSCQPSTDGAWASPGLSMIVTVAAGATVRPQAHLPPGARLELTIGSTDPTAVAAVAVLLESSDEDITPLEVDRRLATTDFRLVARCRFRPSAAPLRQVVCGFDGVKPGSYALAIAVQSDTASGEREVVAFHGQTLELDASSFDLHIEPAPIPQA